MGRHIALMRGINVGGKNKLPMKDLVALFEDLGCRDLRTYIQSGNVVFDGTAALVKKLARSVPAEIDKRFGLKVPVVFRSASELRKVADGNPFLKRGTDLSALAVGFMAGKPTAAQLARLDPDRSPPDRFEVRGKEIYLCFPNGLARSKLTNAYFDSRLGTTTTVRNWKTVLKLIELSG